MQGHEPPTLALEPHEQSTKVPALLRKRTKCAFPFPGHGTKGKGHCRDHGVTTPRSPKADGHGGNTVLISSNLASLPMYMTGMYILPEGVHSSFDKELARFFWLAGDGRPKYHMVKWADVCLPKDRGGLGIPASHRMNVTLILRWVWRILRGDGGGVVAAG